MRYIKFLNYVLTKNLEMDSSFFRIFYFIFLDFKFDRTVFFDQYFNPWLDEASYDRIKALCEIEKDKLRVARAHNKKVKEKSFQVRDLVWKTILPIECKSNKFGK
jgi:hypothetical protein